MERIKKHVETHEHNLRVVNLHNQFTRKLTTQHNTNLNEKKTAIRRKDVIRRWEKSV